MKINLLNVFIGLVVVSVAFYYLYPREDSYEGFETGPGAIIGMVFVGVMGLVILITFFAGISNAG